jgi:hypothetical protein
MHIGHILLVEADSLDEAKADVNHRLDGGYFGWSDWSEIGGRYIDFYVDGDSLRYSDDPEKAEQAIAKAEGFREEQLERYIDKCVENGITITGLDVPKNTRQSFDVYPLYKAAQIASGMNCEETYVYDLSYGSQELDDFRKRVADNPEKQFLIVVDFHH